MLIKSKLQAALVMIMLKAGDIATTLLNVKLHPIGWEGEKNPFVTMFIDPVHYMILMSLVTALLVYYVFDKEKWVVEYVYFVNVLVITSNSANLVMPLAGFAPFFYGTIIGVLLIYVRRDDAFLLGREEGLVSRFKSWSNHFCGRCGSLKRFYGYDGLRCPDCGLAGDDDR